MKNRLLGSTLLIAGTTIGAGMLALPLIAAAIGIHKALLLMLLVWSVSAGGGLLLAEAAQACPEDTSLHGMAGTILGRHGQLVAGAASLFLYYALCAAYISGSAAQLQMISRQFFGIQVSGTASAIAAALMTGLAVSSGTGRVDRLNRFLFPAMLIMLFAVLVVLGPSVDLEHLELNTTSLSSGALLAALPVLYTSFGFHGVVPTVDRYMGRCRVSVRRAIILGSLLPVLIYLVWQIVANGVLGRANLMQIPGWRPCYTHGWWIGCAYRRVLGCLHCLRLCCSCIGNVISGGSTWTA